MTIFVKKNLGYTLPFDCSVTYNGVSKCIDNKFEFLSEPLRYRMNGPRLLYIKTNKLPLIAYSGLSSYSIIVKYTSFTYRNLSYEL